MHTSRVGSSFLAVLRKRSNAQAVLALEPLRLPLYRQLLLTHVLSAMGSEARLMAQAWLILALTNSDGWVGAVTGLPALVAAATALLGGVLADRRDRRAMLVVLQLALSAISLLTALLVATDVVRIWQLLALAFVIACVTFPASRRARAS